MAHHQLIHQWDHVKGDVSLILKEEAPYWEISKTPRPFSPENNYLGTSKNY